MAGGGQDRDAGGGDGLPAGWWQSRGTSVRLLERLRVVSMVAGRMANKALATEVGNDRNRVGQRMCGFVGGGLIEIAMGCPGMATMAGDAPGRGRGHPEGAPALRPKEP